MRAAREGLERVDEQQAEETLDMCVFARDLDRSAVRHDTSLPKNRTRCAHFRSPID